jgi:hypothetical protein
MVDDREPSAHAFKSKTEEVSEDHEPTQEVSIIRKVVILHKNHQISNHYTTSISQVACRPESNVRPIWLLLSDLNYAIHAEEENEETVEKSVEDPSQEDKQIEASALHANLVQIRVLHESVFLVLEVKEGEVHNWKGGHCDIVKLVEECFVQSLSRHC